VAQDGEALVYADAALKADTDVVLAAVARDGEALGYAWYGGRRDARRA
jgi:hypothetical protein